MRVPMAYPDQFKTYREAKGFSREQLAVRADCHRNTVINVECGRPVKFATIAHLMDKMGYEKTSAETKQLALLWLEAVADIQITPGEAQALQKSNSVPTENLQAEISRRKLPKEDIDLLTFAAGHRKVLSALRAIRELTAGPAKP